jgi:SAM-dependent methyltransferase
LDEASFVNGYDVVVCDACGFGFADGIPPQAVFDDHYSRMSRYEYQHRGGEESQFDRDRLESTVSAIRHLIPDPASPILDVGCANGRLLSLLRDAGYSRVEGLDPSQACAEAAQSLYGIHVNVGTINDLDPEDGTFQVVIALGVLEHVRDLGAAMARLRAVLSPGGLLYLAVPDANALADWPNAPFQAFSNEHINFFSQESLANLGRQHGLAPVFGHSGAFEQGRGTSEPFAAVAFRARADDAQPIEPDRMTRRALERYIELSRAQETRIHGIVDDLVNSQTPLIVWGTGTHTTRLLSVSNLAKARITAFVDSNTHYQGLHLRGVPVVSPTDLHDRTETILISSRMFQDEIAQQIRADLGLTNELIRLYEL